MKDKVVIITGASSGIGKALAYEMASRGARVVIAARTSDVLKTIEQDLLSKGKSVMAVTADVSREEDCRNLINATVQKFGRIDVLINNAGISMRAIFADADLAVIARLMNINFWGTVYCTKFALPYLLESEDLWWAFLPSPASRDCPAGPVIRLRNLPSTGSWKPCGSRT